MNHNVNNVLWVIICLCGPTDVNKCPILMQDVISWGDWLVWEPGYMGTLVYFLLNFAVNLKLL